VLNQLKECAASEFQNMLEGEQFVAKLATINALPIRLESIQLKICWNDTISELKASISTVAESCDEIKQSKGLKFFLNLVLLAGNFMSRTKNANSKDAFAFELGVLNKLIDTRDSQNVDTLLHSLIILLEKKSNGRFTNFVADDFHHIGKAVRVDLTEIAKTKDMLQNSLKKVSNHLLTYTQQGDSDLFIDKMKPFVDNAVKDIATVQGIWESMQMKWTLLQKYLCFDPKKYPMEKLFADLKTFKDHYESAYRDIMKRREQSKPKNKPRQPLSELQTNVAGIAKKKALPFSIPDEASSGVIDKIEQMLEQGNYRPSGARTPKSRAPPQSRIMVKTRHKDERTREVPTTDELLAKLREL